MSFAEQWFCCINAWHASFCALCFVLCALCLCFVLCAVLCALCFVLCALCFVLCALCFELLKPDLSLFLLHVDCVFDCAELFRFVSESLFFNFT